MSDDGTEPSWGAGSSAYARLRRLNDDEAGSGFFDRTSDDDLPPAGPSVPPPPASRRRRAGERTPPPPERAPDKAERKRAPDKAERTPPPIERTPTRTERSAVIRTDRTPAEIRADRTLAEIQTDRTLAEIRTDRTPAETERTPARRERAAPAERTPMAAEPVSAAPADVHVPDEAGRHSKRRRSAGRNVPVSILVGILLAGTVLGVLFYAKPWFILVLVAAACVGIAELVRAVRHTGANPPMVPLMVGGTVMLGLAWFRGTEALSLGLLVTVLAVFVWRLADGPAGYQRDMGAAALITVYVPFLLGFAAPLATPADGEWRILTTLAAVVLSDTGGFVAGVLFGKHPMAPTISPKKSWEGFAGSVVAAAIGGAVLMWQLFDVAPWWGALFGAVIAVACVLGDLAESLLKRDLGIKDMSNLLPGHGGLMDRLDSILFALPTAYLLFELLAPPA